LYGQDAKVYTFYACGTKPIAASNQSFFGANALSSSWSRQIFCRAREQRKVTAGGPGGITKERATFSIREVTILNTQSLTQ
jgi:DNA-directed RNA polymerase beta subunit